MVALGTGPLSFGPTRAHLFGAAADSGTGTLVATSERSSAGRDAIGAYTLHETGWAGSHWPEPTTDPYYRTSIRVYDEGGVVVFGQEFPNGCPGGDLPVDAVRGAFPTIPMKQEGRELGFYAFQGRFLKERSFGRFNEGADVPSGISAGPLMFFEHGRRGYTAIVSNFSQFMTSTMVVADGEVQYGPVGSLVGLPAGFQSETIVVFGRAGITATVAAWGSALRAHYGTKRRPDMDISLTTLGYATDNGAYYYHKFDETLGDYEQTLLAVKAYADESRIPYRYMQLDSWWYYRSRDPFSADLNGVPDGGVRNWTARPDVLPSGLSSLFAKLGLHFVAHNRFWAPDNVYRDSYRFLVGARTALPLEPRFWDDLFEEATKWGLRVYEQDWLDQQVERLETAYTTDWPALREWLVGMGKAASRNGITIQYCMPYLCHLLQSLEIDSVSQARASDDYHIIGTQWQIGPVALILDALGLRPSKDTAWSAKVQPGNRYGLQEPDPDLQAAVLAFSNGPVAFSDKIGCSCRARIMRTCRSDGVLLRVDQPLRPLDCWWTQVVFQDGSGPTGHVYRARMAVPGCDSYWFCVLSSYLQCPFQLHKRHLEDELCKSHTPMLAYQWEVCESTGQVLNVRVHDFNDAVTVDPNCLALWYVAPVRADGWCILGELAKFIPIGTMRFCSIRDARIVLLGQPGECVTVCFVHQTNLDNIVQLTTTIQDDGTTLLACPVEGAENGKLG